MQTKLFAGYLATPELKGIFQEVTYEGKSYVGLYHPLPLPYEGSSVFEKEYARLCPQVCLEGKALYFFPALLFG